MMRPIAQQRTSVVRQAPNAGTSAAFFLFPGFFLSPPRSLGLAASPSLPDCAALGEAELRPRAAEATSAAGLSPDWLMTVVVEKAQGRSSALSAAGLLQLAPATVEQLHLADPFDPLQNRAAGARLLAQLGSRYHGGGSCTRGI